MHAVCRVPCLTSERHNQHRSRQVMVVGDVHGQYFDLLNILKRWRPDHNLLFLGDYVGQSRSRSRFMELDYFTCVACLVQAFPTLR